MIKLNKNEVEYKKILIPGKTVESVIGHSPYTFNNEIINDQYNGYIDNTTPFINVMDINWGEVSYGDTTISSTEDLIKNIEEKRLAIEELQTNISTINEQIETIVLAINDLDGRIEDINNEFNLFKEQIEQRLEHLESLHQ